MKCLFSYDAFVKDGVLATERALQLMNRNPMTPRDFEHFLKSLAESLRCSFDEAEEFVVSVEPQELDLMLRERLERCYDFLFMELETGLC
jgi:hypothetical protein